MRKESIITIKDAGRDLKFKVRQMSATETEEWLLKLLLMAASSGGAVNADMSDGGFAALWTAIKANPLKIIGALKYDEAKPLYDKLLSCCKRIDGKIEIDCDPTMIDTFVEDVRTLFTLRLEALKLNFSFLGGDAPSDSQEPGLRIKAGARG